jgi:hypothetical protein
MLNREHFFVGAFEPRHFLEGRLFPPSRFNIDIAKGAQESNRLDSLPLSWQQYYITSNQIGIGFEAKHVELEWEDNSFDVDLSANEEEGEPVRMLRYQGTQRISGPDGL